MFTKTILPAILFAVFALSIPHGVLAQQTSQYYKDMASDILKYENEHRKVKGLPALRMNGIVTAAAEKHTRDMATKKLPFGHDGFNERMEKLYKQLKPVYAFAENVSYGPKTAKEVVEQWLGSEEHKKNIEGKDYNVCGIGIVKSSDSVLYFTQIFIYRGK